MPTYEYRCKKCGKSFEKLQSMSAAPLKTCPRPKCGGRVERLIGGGAGLIFKGSGFYQTDYKKSSSSEKKSESKPKDASAKPDKKTDAK
jgi:putative FmdB family regulatory protein